MSALGSLGQYSAPDRMESAEDSAWTHVAWKAQAYRDASIRDIHPAVPHIPAQDLTLDVSALPKKFLSSEEVEITELSTEGLVAALAERKYTATVVAKAFLRRAGIAQAAVFDPFLPHV